MKILVNNVILTLTDTPSLLKALESWGYEKQTIALALNGSFLPKAQWKSTVLKEGDQLEIITPMQGG